ncbi:putative MFS transporter [Cylindrobasidium torrendii FP15055 ss-10]|uniref:Putative MFS transporter n=1 Tax=Cylindrobasidium torrendii FP15055 ss-10 TaxID=1314674 RepID=A0A0D7BNE9_9AGAR|nr:putative MFS transporter [Cylindrobasidium torrendii FP15055 ss-10]
MSDTKLEIQHQEKTETEHVEQAPRHPDVQPDGVDDALREFGDERIEVTEEDNRRIRIRTDMFLLPILAWTYWLQILDKTILGYASVFGLKADTHLVGNQYSQLGSLNAIAQLVWQPFSSYLLVRVKPRHLMPIIVTCWGISCCGFAASSSFPGLAACRFLLGLFEAACLPLFSILTSVWYRRAEQPMRVAIWYGTNGLGTIMASVFAYGFGHVENSPLKHYQMLYLLCGLLTVVTGPIIYWRLDNNITEARFLTPEDRHKGVERLRANNTGTSATNKYKWNQVVECLIEPQTYLFLGMTLLVNVGASVTTVFGPLVLSGLGFDKYKTSLLNMPFGALQVIIIWITSYCSYQFKNKSLTIIVMTIPVIVGLALLWALPRDNQGLLLFAYYLLAFLYGINPLIISWLSANTAGSTKRSITISGFNGASAAGNIVGPYLFKDSEAPLYLSGLKASLIIFIVLMAATILQIINFWVLNRMKSRERVKNGKPAKIHDSSMDKKFRVFQKDETKDTDKVEASTTGVQLGENAFLDLTDRQNDEFVYVF